LALFYYQLASEALESQIGQLSSDIYMIGFARNKNDVYHRMLRILVDQYAAGHSAEILGKIFNVVERAKAKAFLENLNKGQRGYDLGHFENLAERSNQSTSTISEPFKFRMTENAGLVGLKDRICSLDEVRQQVIEEGTILLEYLLGDDRSYLLSLTSRTAKLSVLPNRRKIESSLRAYLKVISEVSIRERSLFSASKRIGREIIPPEIFTELSEAKAIIIIPDGVLNYLPFETIRINDGVKEEYLIESFSISYCPSASTLRMLIGGSHRKVWKKTILAIGGPKYGNYPGLNIAASDRYMDTKENPLIVRKLTFAELPYSGKEAIDVGRLFPRKESQVITGEDVNEDIVKKLPLWEFRIIHFSCHGYLDEANPMHTSLVLTPGPSQEEDGFLRMEEIYKLSLDADMVVLSACQSGKGILEKGEGVMSLARPFFFAGARSVIAALWPINDKSTADLMREFYKSIIQGRSVNESLRSAKLKMIRSSCAHPFYWSGFVLQGNPGLVRTPHPIS